MVNSLTRIFTASVFTLGSLSLVVVLNYSKKGAKNYLIVLLTVVVTISITSKVPDVPDCTVPNAHFFTFLERLRGGR